jgi:outer membrane protein assembly factor BamB
LLVMAMVVGHGSLGAEDWPQWRGPNADGKSTETGLLKAWPTGGPALAWQVAGLGKGYSGVTLVGDTIFTTGEFGETSQVLALNRADGRRRWSAPLGRGGAPGWGNFAGPRSSVSVAGTRLYALGHYGELVCLESDNGREVWRTHLVEALNGPQPEWGYSESPLVDGEKVLVTPSGDGGTVAALDRVTGKVLWRSGGLTDPAQYATLVSAELGGVRQYVVLTEPTPAGLKEKGRFDQPDRSDKQSWPHPVVAGGFLYLRDQDRLFCYDIRRK